MALSIEDKKKIVSDVNELANNASSLVLADVWVQGIKLTFLNFETSKTEGAKA